MQSSTEDTVTGSTYQASFVQALHGLWKADYDVVRFPAQVVCVIHSILVHVDPLRQIYHVMVDKILQNYTIPTGEMILLPVSMIRHESETTYLVCTFLRFVQTDAIHIWS